MDPTLETERFANKKEYEEFKRREDERATRRRQNERRAESDYHCQVCGCIVNFGARYCGGGICINEKREGG